MKVHFLLLCEGSSDEALIRHLRLLLLECGATEATGVAPDFNRLPGNIPRNLVSKIHATIKLEKKVDLLFVHRDADSNDPEPRYLEISEGVTRARYSGSWIGVVPVQEIEAWLLLDESAIRNVSGRPNGSVPLNLPTHNRIEQIRNPKKQLEQLILHASETTGRRRRRITRKLPALRSKLLTELEPGGPLLSVSSWVRLREDTLNYVQSIIRSAPPLAVE